MVITALNSQVLKPLENRDSNVAGAERSSIAAGYGPLVDVNDRPLSDRAAAMLEAYKTGGPKAMHKYATTAYKSHEVLTGIAHFNMNGDLESGSAKPEKMWLEHIYDSPGQKKAAYFLMWQKPGGQDPVVYQQVVGTPQQVQKDLERAERLLGIAERPAQSCGPSPIVRQTQTDDLSAVNRQTNRALPPSELNASANRKSRSYYPSTSTSFKFRTLEVKEMLLDLLDHIGELESRAEQMGSATGAKLLSDLRFHRCQLKFEGNGVPDYTVESVNDQVRNNSEFAALLSEP